MEKFEVVLKGLVVLWLGWMLFVLYLYFKIRKINKDGDSET